MNDIGIDVTFGLDNFNRPKKISQLEMVKNIILFILFSKKGQIPSIPSIGMNIENLLYQHYEDIDVSSIKEELISQCSILSNFLNGSTIDIEKLIEDGKPTIKVKMVYQYNEDLIKKTQKYQLGITYDELAKMISIKED